MPALDKSKVSSWIGNRGERIGPSRIIVTGLFVFVAATVPVAVAATKLVALGALPREKAAVAMVTSWTVHNIGGASGIAFAIVLTRHVDDFRSGYRMLMLALAAIVMIVGVRGRLLASPRAQVGGPAR